MPTPSDACHPWQILATQQEQRTAQFKKEQQGFDGPAEAFWHSPIWRLRWKPSWAGAHLMGHTGRFSVQAAVSCVVHLIELQGHGDRACLSSPSIYPLPVGCFGVVSILGNAHSLTCRSRLTNCRRRQKMRNTSRVRYNPRLPREHSKCLPFMIIPYAGWVPLLPLRRKYWSRQGSPARSTETICFRLQVHESTFRR